MSKGSNVLIQQLLTAEEEAENIVSRARENRVKKLKDALISADKEIELFKEKEETQFKKEFDERYGHEDTSNADLEEITKKEIELVKKDYKAHKETVVNYLVKRTVEVRMGLEEVQKRFIQEEKAGRGASYQ